MNLEPIGYDGYCCPIYAWQVGDQWLSPTHATPTDTDAGNSVPGSSRAKTPAASADNQSMSPSRTDYPNPQK